ncbi:unnamed protein product [Lathyrus oleraceus]
MERETRLKFEGAIAACSRVAVWTWSVAPAFSTILLRFSCYVVAFLILLHCHGLWSQLDVVTSMDMDLA